MNSTHTAARNAGVNTIPGLLWVAQLTVAVVAVILVRFRAISIPHCGERCDFALLSTVGDVFLWVCVGLVVASGVLTFAFRGRRWARAIPAAGLLATMIAWLIANRISDAALLFS